MSVTNGDILKAAQAWLAQDPDPDTRAELAELLRDATEDGDGDAHQELTDRFHRRLSFGTAGLRGELGAGSNRMNRVLVAQTAAGIAAYLIEKHPEHTPTVVVGYDGRRDSDVFARDSVEIFAGAGLNAVLLPRLLPTPVLAYAVRYLGADAGVMVTASHNPPGDNGYKVYLGGQDHGAQIVPPVDADIAAHILRIADEYLVPELPRSTEYSLVGESVVQAYITATAAVQPAPASATGLVWAYTALHGVGWETFAQVLTRAGYPGPSTVDAQVLPDGNFPTVTFPNPEEPGAMDLVFQRAREVNAELVIAHDPDADRLAVAVPDATQDGGWRQLTGNQVGLLLGWRAARAHAENPQPGASLACSLMSSPGLAAVAERYDLDFHATLTGFKWISRAPGLIFGFEEALGYLVNPETVRDKDGISAAIAILALATHARADGRGLAELVQEFEETFGYFASDQVSIRTKDAATIEKLMSSLREEPPTSLGTVQVQSVDDLLQGVDGLPPADALRLWLSDGSRVIVRPSGTEPKLKMYLDVRGESAADAQGRLSALSSAARELLTTRAPSAG